MWFDWRMIPVGFMVIFGLLVAFAGVMLLMGDWLGVPARQPPSQILLGGLALAAAGVGIGYWCSKNPDAGT